MVNDVALDVRTTIDADLLMLGAHDLSTVLHGPTLFDLSKPNQRPLFVATLLHGNETSGWDALRSVLPKYVNRSLIVFLGNVKAASQGLRSLPGDVDFNRIWHKGDHPGSELADDVMHILEQKQPWFSLDIHNNSGPNPHYSVITEVSELTCAAARAFSDTAILAEQPPGVLTRRTAPLCPSITIEVGMPSDLRSAERAAAYVEQLTCIERFNSFDTSMLRIYNNSIKIVVRANGDSEFRDFPLLNEELDQFNFQTVPSGHKLADLKSNRWFFSALNGADNDVTTEYLTYYGNSVVLKRDSIISMYTRDPVIATDDCVCYFLEDINFKHG